jgi:glucose uptake protein GlcU
MGYLVTKLLLNLVSLVGAILNTIGFLTFFFWESLQPYRWQLIIGGIVLIVVADIIDRFLLKKIRSPD